ncbi:hypothetical protein [Pseudoclavibacter helvolus]|uniref:hypothetical protein n=1 Tax=Pseudoclavibacter helvolus TaxID=255205 RepID=UPI0035E931A0
MDVSIQEFSGGMAWGLSAASIFVAYWALALRMFRIVRTGPHPSHVRVALRETWDTMGPLLLVVFLLSDPSVLLAGFTDPTLLGEGWHTFVVTHWWVVPAWLVGAFVAFAATSWTSDRVHEWRERRELRSGVAA